jgi:hypothetical protein
VANLFQNKYVIILFDDWFYHDHESIKKLKILAKLHPIRESFETHFLDRNSYLVKSMEIETGENTLCNEHFKTDNNFDLVSTLNSENYTQNANYDIKTILRNLKIKDERRSLLQAYSFSILESPYLTDEEYENMVTQQNHENSLVSLDQEKWFLHTRIAREVLNDSIESHLPRIDIDDEAILTREMSKRLRERRMNYEIEDSEDGEVIIFGNLRFVNIEDISEYFINLILQQPVWEQENLSGEMESLSLQ